MLKFYVKQFYVMGVRHCQLSFQGTGFVGTSGVEEIIEEIIGHLRGTS